MSGFSNAFLADLNASELNSLPGIAPLDPPPDKRKKKRKKRKKKDRAERHADGLVDIEPPSKRITLDLRPLAKSPASEAKVEEHRARDSTRSAPARQHTRASSASPRRARPGSDDLVLDLYKEKRLKEHQDLILEDMAQVVNRLTDMSYNIEFEVEATTELVQDLDEDVSQTHTTLDFTLSKLNALVKKSGKTHCWIILALSFIAFIEFFLILFT